MSIPKIIKIKRRTPSPGLRPPSPLGRGEGEGLPTKSGVYLFRDKKGKVIYIGKATNLKSRVTSYWKGTDKSHSAIRANRRMGRTIEEMIDEVWQVDYQVTDSVIEALILEANLIKKYQPRYNVREKDDKSFLYVLITKEHWPKVMLTRGNELKLQKNQRGQFDAAAHNRPQIFLRIFGPYTSASAIRAALDLMRKWFPWSTCKPLHTTSYILHPRPCFDYHIGRCPGVCIGAVTRKEYMKNIRNVILMLEGKKARVIKNVKLKMQNEAKLENFEEAEALKRKLFALEHIRDVAVLTRDTLIPERSEAKSKGQRPAQAINVFGRIEGYDISNLPAGKAGISGTSAVGSMVVFEDGEPKKSEYRKFRIKTVPGINDVAMMREILQRRFRRIRNHELGIRELRNHDSLFQIHNSQIWKIPDLLVIDGGWGQVNAAQEVIDDMRKLSFRGSRKLSFPNIPIIGIAKGFKRKQDRPIFEKNNPELARIVENYKDLLLRVRDEAHRFAVSYHRKLRSRNNNPLLR
ncbi:hypothetical protein A3B21_00715 [Candidatus Uhrbacteria bacterium RIFCSPLOWO2_01_FULL_47_24]|uniref:Excinuclease ABC subunit C n=1 Tax=Candidatus Uhrbacteria bacterium RIFCSPLOWO2_01_FULL_47_24 TaxID=1802401 RepID=A0A1F7UQB4_9BACT|nr:MAG: hypothetical protein A3D58_04605 [Candidatus Uhrbacteria bacterium RIFCSPHIGHO2_02_FULL_46_47]OGL74876.1 MAG: hypothetical protein A3F52_00370 [Candidatus Uhrbacteria bacterium RIFCSPHIGHO2_12_FULL_47_11]OGL79898.1 MAG: hypothetical protein A3B21_00715 [Candidatus Uhrbacteria bacterium RIFCSPLOWO2_01_FULL_47_24]OGL84119.1 MAG: hypothetical protein A3J03_03510 [Candidatus Uhrbacteria bacterium RIFCSPLOWO2_02_FULL_46_25]OGL91967.1 MAG: hypothetical protein A3H11_01060 [Candidatus Uhrbacte